MNVKVLGVSASPRRGNTSILVQAALLGAASLPEVETAFEPLAGRAIAACNGCGPCRQVGHCVLDDDMQPLYERLLWADAIVLGTPVYYGQQSGRAMAFMARVQGLGVAEKKLRLKVGGAIATGASRNGGQETTLLAVNLWFHVCDMLPVGITAPVSQWGATGFTGSDPTDAHRDATDLKLAPHTVGATQMAWMYGRKLATVARIVREGIAASGLDLPDAPYGYSLPQEFPAELEDIAP